jgi:hypothetical protein
MFERFIEWLLEKLDSIPILLGAEPHNAHLVRAVAALFLIMLFVYIMAMRPFRGVVGRLLGRSKDRQR